MSIKSKLTTAKRALLNSKQQRENAGKPFGGSMGSMGNVLGRYERNAKVLESSRSSGDYNKMPQRRDAEVKRHMSKYGTVK